MEIEGLDGCVYIKHKGLTDIIRKTDRTIIVPPKYHYIGDFSEGRAKVRFDKKYGFVNLDGKEIVECVWDYAEDFKDGKALVQSLNGDFYIGINNKLLQYNKKLNYAGNRNF